MTAGLQRAEHAIQEMKRLVERGDWQTMSGTSPVLVTNFAPRLTLC
jgi:hypothetical protein